MASAAQGPGEALGQDFSDLLQPGLMTHVAVRLLVAAVLGGVLGLQRERAGKSAGLRTYMLVAMGSAFFILVPQLDGMALEPLARVVQGIATGIGFVGGGAILKLGERREIKGLTTAAGIWLTAAVGIAVGFGRVGAALVGTGLAYLVLAILGRLERLFEQGRQG
jgi:putative Mg2+ transporter-C (MgtC) family protein